MFNFPHPEVVYVNEEAAKAARLIQWAKLLEAKRLGKWKTTTPPVIWRTPSSRMLSDVTNRGVNDLKVTAARNEKVFLAADASCRSYGF